jgi:hypothetical protein
MSDDLRITINGSVIESAMGLSSVESASWETTLLDQPGKLTFDYQIEQNELFDEGNRAVASYGDQTFFDGFIFSRERTEGGKCSVTCYDRLRYLQAKGSFNFETSSGAGMDAGDIFYTIINHLQLPAKNPGQLGYTCPPKHYSGTSYYDMLKDALDWTMIATGKYYTLRDNIGFLEITNIQDLATQVIVGDGSLLTGFSFKSDIGTQTYNYVEVVGKGIDKQVAKDTASYQRWGMLQYYESNNDITNAAQAQQRAKQLLSLYDRPLQTLSLNCMGEMSVQAGSWIWLHITELKDESSLKSLDGNRLTRAFVTKATHKFEESKHTMDLEIGGLMAS